MSVLFGSFCRDCVQSSPPVGDGGYLGAPSLQLSPVRVSEFQSPVPSFAYLYEPLEALSLRPYETERFREWLRSHDGHRVVLFSEEAPPEFEQLEQEERGPEWYRRAVALTRKLATDSDAAVHAGIFRDALYTLRCVTCTATFSAADVDRLRAFEAHQLSPSAIDVFLDRWNPIVEGHELWAYRLMGVLDDSAPFLEGLFRFLKSHRHHTVAASLDGEPE